MGIAVDPVPCVGDLPPSTEVVVIGGGIIGVSAALTLAERGIPVVLCEKGHIAGEQSSRNWGWCRQMGRDPRELPLIIESLRLWRGMNARIGEETGFRQCGIVYLSLDEAALEKRRQWLEYAKPFQLDSRIVTEAEIKALLPGLTTPVAGGLFTASDGRAEPQKAAPAMARAARAKGAVILQNCAVRGIEYEAGRVKRVVTEKGAIICKAVILAGGAWSSAFLRNQGLRFPQLTTRASVLRTGPLEGAPEVSSWGPGYAFRRRLDGGYNIAHGDFTVPDIVPDSFRYISDFLPVLKMDWRTLRPRLGRRFVEEWQRKKKWRLNQVSPFEEMRTLDPQPLGWVNRLAMKNLIAAHPVFAKAQVIEAWAGFIDSMPDVVPVISPVDGHDGLIIASGFSGHGFGIGPAAGELAADLATGAKPLVDPAPFRYSRFTDGSKPHPITGL